MSLGPDPRPASTPPVTGRGRRVLLVVTGGIAAYKSCLVVRRLVDAGCEVRVAMTAAAQRFVTPLTFEALSGKPVGTTLWGEGGEEPLDHVQWAQQCELVLVAPATADFLAKMAHGLADDLPSTLICATDAPIVVAPAMNDRMWRNPANQQNLRTLVERGITVVDPGSGYLACGTVAEGRLAEPETLVSVVLERLGGGPLRGKRVLVTAGGTREPIDPVRWIGNHSSGRMGIALAAAARDAGAEVTLLLGPTELEPPRATHVERFVTTADLAASLGRHAEDADVVLMAAAVSDFRPARPSPTKLKKEQAAPDSLELEPTEDLLAGLAARRRPGQILVGFALETGDDATVELQAARKLEAKGLDLVCGNRADVDGEGFSGPTNRLFLYDAAGRGQWTASGAKLEVARLVIARVAELEPRGGADRASA